MTTARRVLIAAGTLIMGYAVTAMLFDADGDPFGVLLFLGGALVAHDAVLLPPGDRRRRADHPAGAGPRPHSRPGGRRCSPWRLLVATLPLALGFGRSTDNPSVLPLPYARNLALIVALIWLLAAADRCWRARRPGQPRQPHDQPER